MPLICSTNGFYTGDVLEVSLDTDEQMNDLSRRYEYTELDQLPSTRKHEYLRPSKKGRKGLWFISSFFNHQCSLVKSQDNNATRFPFCLPASKVCINHIRALRDIKAGEQVFIRYNDKHSELKLLENLLS